MPDSVLEDVQRARRHVDALRLALQSPSPEELERYLPALEEAVACLQGIEQSLSSKSGNSMSANSAKPAAGDLAGDLDESESADHGLQRPMLQQLHALNNELEIAQRLVIHGTAFCDTWARMLGGAAGGYVASGDAAPLSIPGTVSVEG